MLCSSDVYTLINYTSFVESGFIGISVAGLLYLRYKCPDMHRPIKVRTSPYIFARYHQAQLDTCYLGWCKIQIWGVNGQVVKTLLFGGEVHLQTNEKAVFYLNMSH